MQAETTNFGKIGMLFAGLAIVASCAVSAREESADRPSFCTREYAPVCGIRGSARQTFGNACEARSAGYRVTAEGRC